MTRKRVLIVSRSFYPENSPRSFRTTELVKEFARQGHDVTLVIPQKENFHTLFEEKFGVSIKDMGLVRFGDIDTSRGNKVWILVKRAVRRGLLMLFDFPNIEFMFKTKKALEDVEGYDLLISIAVPHSIHWGVAWAYSNNDDIANVWAADCGDPYVGLESNSFKIWPHFRIVEKWFCRKANYITVPFDGARSGYFQEFHEKIRVIPQGLSIPELDTDTEYQAVKNQIPLFAYIGNISSYLHYAVPFLKMLNETESDFKFIVYTKRKDLFESILSKNTLKKCDIRDYTDRENLFKELAKVNFVVHFPYQNGSQRSLKLIDYAFIGKPILSFVDSQKSHESFSEFINGDYTKGLIVDNPEQYRIDNVTRQFLDLCKEN